MVHSRRLLFRLLAVLLITLCPAARADESPRFSRHVQAVFSRLGCNGGTCHGAVKGQNGFQLSLFGADSALDHERLLRGEGGRRLNLHHPDSSLLLLKATSAVAHQGGKRTTTTSRDYDILRRWIAAGAPSDPPDRSRVTRLQVQPSQHTLPPAKSYPLQVQATFADGTTEDVTRLCSFQTNDAAVATVSADGVVTTHGVGDTAIIVRFRADPALALIAVPRKVEVASPQANNFIDHHILAKLQRLGIPSSPLADDATFLRRVSLDVAGELPTPREIRDFLANPAPDNRQRKIEELLARPGYAALWTLKFCDLLKASDFGVYADGMRQELDAPRFQAWVRARIEENTPYDQLVERILTATSRDGRDVETWAREVVQMEEGYTTGRPDLGLYRNRKTLDLYWQRSSSTGVDATLQVAHAFLGLRLECAQCHRHPHDVWQQDDLLSFANFFMPVRKIGFQGDNEKKFPEVAAVFKRLNTEAKTLETEAKKLRSMELAKIKKTPETLDKFNELQKRITSIERRSKQMPEAARRLMHAEVRITPVGKSFATVSSPIGKQTSTRFRLLGHTSDTKIPEGKDPRQVVMDWLRQADNPFFARAMVNRVWAHYFGRGIVDPPDNLSSFNPATHPELLDALAQGFIQHEYDLKWLHRQILYSRTYQQSSTATEANDFDRSNYAYFGYRRLPAEVLLDAVNNATGTSEKMGMEYHHWPAEIKTIEIPFTPKNAFVTFMLTNFGKPKRNAAVQCDCERDGNASALQVLMLANHPRLLQKIADDKGLVARVAKEIGESEKQIEELFLVTVSRLPTANEQKACVEYLKGSETTTKGLQGILWSLINTREFVLQH